MNSSDQKGTEPSAQFPVAEIREAPEVQKIFVSKMWWGTLVCAIIALGLAWRSMPTDGPQLTIEFPQGHGLKAGDALRHRGIDVGIVQTASLKSDLNGIQVVVELNPEAECLRREGSRFWVVRPRVGLAGIEGLETVVGARYIAVSPGPSAAARQTAFDGLVMAPPDEFSGEGLELMLRAEARSGLNPGAPITWRGVQVGQVLSVGLSPDASHVNVNARIGASYRQLVKSNSRFWVTSGLGVHIGLSGIDLNADSLASLVLGGISFITPRAEEPLTEVHNGHVFSLHSVVDDSWLENAAVIPLIDVDLPETVMLEGSVETSFLGIRRHKPFSASGVLLRTGDAIAMLTASVPINDAGSGPCSPQLQLRSPRMESIVGSLELLEAGQEESGIQLFEFPHSEVGHVYDRAALLRIPTFPEECCVCRTVFGEGDSSSIIHAIGSEQLTARDGIWMLSHDADLSAWNGAPVVALGDGRVIGVLTATEHGIVVVPISAGLMD